MNTKIKELIHYVRKNNDCLSVEDAEQLTSYLYKEMISRIEGVHIINNAGSEEYKKGYAEGIRMCSNLVKSAFGHTDAVKNHYMNESK